MDKLFKKSIFMISRTRRCYSVRVRFAPSPTGHLHLGGFRTALLNYLFALKHKGQFILRIEDTDQTRTIPGASDKLEEDLKWLGIAPIESPTLGGPYAPYIQSQRLMLYQNAAKQLLQSSNAYLCFCTEKRLELLRKDSKGRQEVQGYDGKCRDLDPIDTQKRIDNGHKYCIRFKMPEPPFEFHDIVYGPVSIEEHQTDFVILKSDKFPTYHLANVVDDYEMKITHVLRGFEWQVSTGKHLALYKALGYPPPKFAHLPLLLNKDGSKFSKRQGTISIDHFRNSKYYPEALANFVMGNTHVIESMEELASKFELSSLSISRTKLDFLHLDQLNRLYLKEFRNASADGEGKIDVGIDDLRSLLPGESEEYYRRLLAWCPERVSKLPDLNEEYPFLTTRFLPTMKSDGFGENESNLVKVVIEKIENSDSTVTTADLKAISEIHGIPFKNLMNLMRWSLCGVQVGPPVAEIVNLLGKDETLRRLKYFIKIAE